MRTLPPHPDARPALERLRSAGYRLAALTNSTTEVEEAQLRNAGLSDLFEKALSADSGKRLKPAAEAYANAARALGVPTSEMRMVAAHVWDVQGALRAGCAAAFVERPGAVWNPVLGAWVTVTPATIPLPPPPPPEQPGDYNVPDGDTANA